MFGFNFCSAKCQCDYELTKTFKIIASMVELQAYYFRVYTTVPLENSGKSAKRIKVQVEKAKKTFPYRLECN